MKTVGTVLGDTISADCSIPGAGQAALQVFLQTPNGAWVGDLSDVISDNGSNSAITIPLNVPPGTLSSPAVVGGVLANPSNTADHQADIVQTAPAPGYMVWHESAAASSTTQTCRLSVMAFPTTISTVAGARLRNYSQQAGTHVILRHLL